MITEQANFLHTILKEIQESTEGLKTFTFGKKSYANLNYTKDNYPRVHCYPYDIIEQIEKSDALTITYTIVLDFMQLCKLNDSPENIEKIVESMNVISREYVLRLAKHKSVVKGSLTKVLRSPLYHLYDDNIAGWGAKFEMKVIEPIKYPC